MWRQKWLLLEQNITSSDPRQSHTSPPHYTLQLPAHSLDPRLSCFQPGTFFYSCSNPEKNSVLLQMKPELLQDTFAHKNAAQAVVIVLLRRWWTCTQQGCFFPNVYSYSTVTTNAVSDSNFNQNVNLFPVTPYWLPSLIPSSIIFSWDWFLFFLFCCCCWWWRCAFSRQSNLGKQVVAPIVQLFPRLPRFHLLNHCFRLIRSSTQFFFVQFCCCLLVHR